MHHLTGRYKELDQLASELRAYRRELGASAASIVHSGLKAVIERRTEEEFGNAAASAEQVEKTAAVLTTRAGEEMKDLRTRRKASVTVNNLIEALAYEVNYRNESVTISRNRDVPPITDAQLNALEAEAATKEIVRLPAKDLFSLLNRIRQTESK